MRLVEIRSGWIVDVDSISEVKFKAKREPIVSCSDGVQKYHSEIFYYVEIVVDGREREIPFDNEEEALAFYDRFLKEFCKEKWI